MTWRLQRQDQAAQLGLSKRELSNCRCLIESSVILHSPSMHCWDVRSLLVVAIATSGSSQLGLSTPSLLLHTDCMSSTVAATRLRKAHIARRRLTGQLPSVYKCTKSRLSTLINGLHVSITRIASCRLQGSTAADCSHVLPFTAADYCRLQLSLALGNLQSVYMIPKGTCCFRNYLHLRIC